MTGKAKLYIGKMRTEPERKWEKGCERGVMVNEFQKRPECDDWYFGDISVLTGISDMKKKNLNGTEQGNN